MKKLLHLNKTFLKNTWNVICAFVMIFQKSFKYADLVLNKHKPTYQYWKQLSCFKFLWKLINFFRII